MKQSEKSYKRADVEFKVKCMQMYGTMYHFNKSHWKSR